MRFLHQDMSLFRNLPLDIARGAMLSLVILSAAVFLSPPLPFYDHMCATGRHEPIDVLVAIALLLLRWRLRRGRVHNSFAAGPGFTILPPKVTDLTSNSMQ